MPDSLVDAVERLFREFEDQYSLTEIVAVVRECRKQLCCSPQGALPELVERLARQRLTSRRPGATDDRIRATAAG